MKAISVLAAVLLSVGIFTNGATAAPKSGYNARYAHCKQQARAMKFGVHWIKRNRWIRACASRRA